MNWKASESDPAPESDERDESEKILTELSQENMRLREINAGLRGELQVALLRAERAERKYDEMRAEIRSRLIKWTEAA